MNTEKLIDSILNDLSELNLLTEDLRTSQSMELDLDIAVSKAKLITRELQLLKEQIKTASLQSKKGLKYSSDDEETSSFIPEEPEMEIVAGNEIVPDTAFEIEEPEFEYPEEKFKIDSAFLEIDEEELPEEEEEEELVEEPEVEEEIEEEEPEVEEEIEEEPVAEPEEEKEEEAPKTLHEAYQQVQSQKEPIDEAPEQKLMGASINSLQSSISINDQFLFIREIFSNDADKYNETIQKLDNMANIKEAADFLSMNFKIKKTETSLKFVELIKRRFA